VVATVVTNNLIARALDRNPGDLLSRALDIDDDRRVRVEHSGSFSLLFEVSAKFELLVADFLYRIEALITVDELDLF
jgi:hypothetical protein